MADDLVAELDAWLPGGVGRRGSYDDLRNLVLRARDEILALQVRYEAIRTAALEEAAQRCEQIHQWAIGGQECAAAIRALKDRQCA
jgi:hypothetical protein